jgi:hypothetical protein
MDQQEIDSYSQLPFRSEDAARQDALLRTLGFALWGTTADELKRQLLAPHPAVPSDFALSDFRELLKVSARMSAVDLQYPNYAWARSVPFYSAMISIDDQQLTASEARLEIVRRAIEYLESH